MLWILRFLIGQRKHEELIESLELDQYAVVGNDDAWAEALAGARKGVAPSSLSVKSSRDNKPPKPSKQSSKKQSHKEKRRKHWALHQREYSSPSILCSSLARRPNRSRHSASNAAQFGVPQRSWAKSSASFAVMTLVFPRGVSGAKLDA